MSTQSATIKVWCRNDDLQHTANMISWAIGHRIEIPNMSLDTKNTYLFVITDIEQYESEEALLARMGFDMIGKIAGVISWEVLPRGYQPTQNQQDHADEDSQAWFNILDTLPVPISIVERVNGTYSWKWLSASGIANSHTEAVRAALTHVMKSYTYIRSELVC